MQGGRLLDFPAAGDAADPGQADVDAVAEQRQVLCGHRGGDGGQALAAREVAGVDQAAQGFCDLAGPDRGRVRLGGVLKITKEMLAAKLVADAVEGVVVLVPVVHDHGAVQVAVDEVLERGQLPAAEEVIGEQAGAGDLQVLLLVFGPGPARSGVSSPQMTRARMISARIAVFARRPP